MPATVRPNLEAPTGSDPKRTVADHLARVTDLLKRLSVDAIGGVVEVVGLAHAAKRAVYTLGNGGSAATALHLANDLTRMGVAGQGLASNVSTMSALANDHGYEEVFAGQLRTLVRPGHVVIAISGSGNSPNCIRALEEAGDCGAIKVGLLGFDGGAIASMCDRVVLAANDAYESGEDAHLAVCHALSLAPKQL